MSSTRRLAKVERAIREAISTAVLFEMRDPRVTGVTVLKIDVSPDLLAAKVHVSVMGDEKTQSLCMHGLRSARGFLQKKVADRIQTRYTPILSFELDETVKKGAEAARILREIALANGEVYEPTPADDFDETTDQLDSEDEDDDDIDLAGDDENPPIEDDNFT